MKKEFSFLLLLVFFTHSGSVLAGVDSTALYKKTIHSADSLFAKKQYENAKLNYVLAAHYKPTEKYPQLKLDECRKYIGWEEAKKSIYHVYMYKGDSLFKKEKYLDAMEYYNRALTEKRDSLKPKLKIQECQQKQYDAPYKQFIAAGDKEFKAQNYQQAIEMYQRALNNKPGEVYPKDMIAKCKQAIDTRPPAGDKYTMIVKKAEALFDQKKYPEAKKLFEEAYAMKPDLLHAKNRIEEINKILSETK